MDINFTALGVKDDDYRIDIWLDRSMPTSKELRDHFPWEGARRNFYQSMIEMLIDPRPGAKLLSYKYWNCLCIKANYGRVNQTSGRFEIDWPASLPKATDLPVEAGGGENAERESSAVEWFDERKKWSSNGILTNPGLNIHFSYSIQIRPPPKTKEREAFDDHYQELTLRLDWHYKVLLQKSIDKYSKKLRQEKLRREKLRPTGYGKKEVTGQRAARKRKPLGDGKNEVTEQRPPRKRKPTRTIPM